MTCQRLFSVAQLNLTKEWLDAILAWLRYRPTHQVRKGDRSRPFGDPLLLGCFFVDCAVNLLPRVFVNFHVVFFATVLLDLGHDLRFTVATDLPFTVFGANVRAAETRTGLINGV